MHAVGPPTRVRVGNPRLVGRPRAKSRTYQRPGHRTSVNLPGHWYTQAQQESGFVAPDSSAITVSWESRQARFPGGWVYQMQAQAIDYRDPSVGFATHLERWWREKRQRG